MKQLQDTARRKRAHTKVQCPASREEKESSRRERGADAERAALRVLKRLAGGQTWLRVQDARGEYYGLYSPRKAFAEAELTVSGRQVADWLARDWLEPLKDGGGRLKLSAPGLAWLRRLLSSGDPFQEQHRVVCERAVEVEGVLRPVVINDAESPLSWLRSRKDRTGQPLITAWQFEAGERLRADFGRGMMEPHMTANLQDGASGGRRRRSGGAAPGKIQDYVIDARQRVRDALIAVGPELAGVVFDVCCCLKGLEEEEQAQGWPRRSGKIVLQIGLTRLARHYGLLAGEQIPGAVSRRLVHWGAGDYRPAMDGPPA